MSRRPDEFRGHWVSLNTCTYRGVVQHVVDGDTLDVLVDLGFNQYHYAVIRVRGVNTPELIGGTEEQRLAARNALLFVRKLLLGQPVRLRTYRDAQTFGRYVADVEYVGPDGTVQDLATTLTHLGFGAPSGSTPR